MLQLDSVTKSYTTGDFTQTALDEVSISFRDNEFVAVLGPSGSGKTTLLNIVGGLDHADSGEVVIDGISTREYRDRDWDTYRNNRIGFVFQSYNLIPHQSVLSNVELALTLAGVSRAERRKRAMTALEDVGLTEHVHKRPSQLSGGQMQRVAIARSLINDPEILLADEPTGALDSVTSTQIMGLLTGIARDRLVIMVTHNPELAEAYATRTVALSDGVVVQDTDPYHPPAGTQGRSRSRRTAMSFLTALALSFNNLLTKKGRTLMTAFAGSIGIIGIASILALANGVGAHIKGIEEDTLSMYPLSIQRQGIDLTSLLVPPDGVGPADDLANGGQGGQVREFWVLDRMLSGVTTNDLASLKQFIDTGGSGMGEFVNAVEFTYDVTPQIYLPDSGRGVHQVHPDSTFSALGFGGGMAADTPLVASMGTGVFSELVSDLSLVEDQYDVVAGDWPDSADEVLVVLSERGGLSDYMFYGLGLRDRTQLETMVEQLVNEEEVVLPRDSKQFTVDDVMAARFRLVHATDYYTLDETYDLWTDRSTEESHVSALVARGEELRVAGIVRPRADASATPLEAGLYYTPMLTHHVIQQAAQTPIVQAQLTDRGTNVFSGRSFLDDTPADDFDLSSLITINESAITDAFVVDESMLTVDPSGLEFNMPGISIDPASMPELDLSGVDIDITDVIQLPAAQPPAQEPAMGVDPEELGRAATELVEAYQAFAEASGLDPAAMEEAWPLFLESDEGFAALQDVEEALPTDVFDLAAVVEGYLQFAYASGVDPGDVATNLPLFRASPEGVEILEQATGELPEQPGFIEDYLQFTRQAGLDPLGVEVALPLFLASDGGMQAFADSGIALDFSRVEQQLQGVLTSYMGEVMATYTGQVGSQIGAALESQIGTAMESVMGELAATLPNAMSVDEEALANAFQFEDDPEELTRLLMALTAAEQNTYERNLRRLGYAELDNPSRVDLYPIDFQSKGQVINILDTYNEDQREQGNDDQVITYTDIVGALMSSVTDIINMVSYVLVAFVAISLVVSSIMIGVITYISVLERRKEIGILRAVGASKGDVARVFNAETLIIGFVAGAMGIIITYLLTFPANAIVASRFDVARVAQLPWLAAVVLVGISMLLSLLAGIIPSSAASRKDPVEALRSE